MAKPPRKQKSFPLPTPPSIFLENGLELRGSLSLSLSLSLVGRKTVSQFFLSYYGPATGRRRQLDEHESPGETALLTGYLLGSREGGTYSPLEPNQPPSSAFFCLVPAIRFVVIACFWSHRRRGGRGRPSFFSLDPLHHEGGRRKVVKREGGRSPSFVCSRSRPIFRKVGTVESKIG